MKRRAYALERGGEERLRLRWRRKLRDFEVELDGQAWKLDRAAIDAGATITLPGGSALLVQRVRRAWWSIELRDELRLERDGVPVPGSDGDPRVIGRRAAALVLLLSLLRLGLVGLWFAFAGGNAGGAGGAGGGVRLERVLPLAAEQLLLVVLAVLAAFGRRTPVAIAAGVLALELVAVLSSGTAPTLGVLIQILVVVHLVGAWRRMRPRPAAASLAQVFE